MADQSGPQRPFWVETRSTPTTSDEDLRRHPSVFQMSRAGVLHLSVDEILDHDLGFAASARARTGILGSGEPIPLMSYALVEYVMASTSRALACSS